METNFYSCKALTVRQPLADEIAYGKTDHLLMKTSTKFRGDMVLTAYPEGKERTGMTICIVELTDVKKVEGGYLWRFINPRPIVEMPCPHKGKKLWDYIYFQGEIIPYPTSDLRGLMKIPGRYKKDKNE